MKKFIKNISHVNSVFLVISLLLTFNEINGQKLNIDYDSSNQIKLVSNSYEQKIIYQYDALGNRTAIIIPCQPPVNLIAENVTEASVTITWQQVGSFNTWNILWGEEGFNPDNQGNLIQDISETQFTITNLDPETTYDVYVNSNCNASEQSEWRGPCTFTTSEAVLAVYEVSGGGSYCETDWPNGEVYLSGSQTEAVYQLYKDGIPEGQLKNGNGGMLFWYDLSDGNYTIKGTRNQITAWMNGSVTVSEIGIPDIYAGADATISPGESYTLADATALNYAAIMWLTTGDGEFNNPVIVNPTYNPGPYDIASGYAELIMDAMPVVPCVVYAEDYVTLSITIPPPQQIITLNNGWSGISSYISPTQASVDVLFQPIINQLVILQGTDGFYWPGENINTLINWNSYSGHKIKVTSNTSLSITGNYLINKTISLGDGWNLMPVLSECMVPIEDLFNETDIVVAKEVGGTAVFWPAFGINTLQLLVPGKAYFVLMGTGSQVTFPDCTDEKSELEFNNSNSDPTYQIPDLWADINETANSHIIALPAKTTRQFTKGDLIGVFSESGQLCGVTVIEDPEEPNVIIVYGDDPTTFEIDGFVEDQQMNLRVFQPSTGIENSLSIVYNKNLRNAGYFVDNGLSAVENIELTIISGIASGTLTVDIHPNPSLGVFNVSLNEVSPADYEVYDIHGVGLLEVKNQSGGFKIDLSGYAKGIYYLKIEQGGLQVIRKLVLQ